MKKTISVIKSMSLIGVGLMLGITTIYVGASLVIPSNIDNAVQVIKTILVSSDGYSTSGDNIIVAIDSITTTGAALRVMGNVQFGDRNNISSRANGLYSSVLGGDNNKILNGMSSTIAGGRGNNLTGDFSTIAGGDDNNMNGTNSTIVGGFTNNLVGNQSNIVGGQTNTIAGNYSTIVGGSNNTVNGNYSFAGGNRARINHNSVFMWADENYI